MSIHENISDLISQVSKLDFNRVTVKDFKIQELTEAKPKYKNNGLDLLMTVSTEDNDSDEFQKWMEKVRWVAFNLDYSVVQHRPLDNKRSEFFLRHDKERSDLLFDLRDKYSHTSLTILVRHVQQNVTWECSSVYEGGYNVCISSTEDVIMCDDLRVEYAIVALGFKSVSIYCDEFIRDFKVTKKGE